MSFFRALSYFLREAVSGLTRGWKASVLATVTIAVSLFVWGAFLLAGQNLGGTLAKWRGEARLIVYVAPGATLEEAEELEAWVGEAPWVYRVRPVSAEEAAERFEQAFPSLEDLMGGWSESPLPASIEISMRDVPEDRAAVSTWLDQLTARPEVDMVDDDRDWIQQIESIAGMARTVGMGIGLVLLGAASFTIASVVKLNAYTYQDEIEIMRIVGATEFLIRGPFYCEGLLQGLLGGLMASGGLFVAHQAVLRTFATDGVLTDILLRHFLGWPQLGLLVLVGTLAGLLGVLLSLRGESLAVEET